MAYIPPPWCQCPRDPVRQSLRLVSAGSSKAVDVFDKAVYTIGRGDTADVKLKGDLASRMHAAILQDVDGQKFLVDLRSANGTFLDSKRLEPHQPVKWLPAMAAAFGYGPATEVLSVASDDDEPPAKRPREGAESVGPAAVEDPLAALYGDLPEATVTVIEKPPEREKDMERIVPVADPTKIIFLDVDGCLRSLHGNKDFMKHARTMEVNGKRVALVGSSESMAGIDFWPQAMRALRHIVMKTGARIVLSSDWRKADVLRDGVANMLEEYRIPAMFGCTPDLDKAQVGVLKALHTSFREKRCKEIRKFLRANPKIEQWVAIDDIDLAMPDKEARVQAAMKGRPTENQVFLDPFTNFVRCDPAEGLTMDRARLAIRLLHEEEVTVEELKEVYGQEQEGS